MSIASRLSLGMSDIDKEWIEKILSTNNDNLQPKSPEFDSGVSLDSDMPAKERLDVDMDFLKSPLSVENGTEISDVGVVDGDKTLYSNFDEPTPDPYPVSVLETNFFDDDDPDQFIFNPSQQPVSTADQILYDVEFAKFSCHNNNNNNNNLDYYATTSTTTNSQILNSLSPATNHFEFSGDNSNHHENLNTPNALSDEETIKKEDMDDKKQKSRLLRNKKNAEMAKVSRQKKKDHLQNLENEVKGLTENNGKLKKENQSLLSIVKHKDREINYLKNILAHHSAISQMINYLSLNKIHLSSEFSSNNHWPQISSPNCDQTSYDDEYTNNRPHAAGICLHFKPDNHVSLEFCVQCSQSSQMIINQQNQGQYCLDKENS